MLSFVYLSHVNALGKVTLPDGLCFRVNARKIYSDVLSEMASLTYRVGEILRRYRANNGVMDLERTI